jgi:hypothetical protein
MNNGSRTAQFWDIKDRDRLCRTIIFNQAEVKQQLQQLNASSDPGKRRFIHRQGR